MKKIWMIVPTIALTAVLTTFFTIQFIHHSIYENNYKLTTSGISEDLKDIYAENTRYVLFNSTASVAAVDNNSYSFLGIVDGSGVLKSIHALGGHYDGIGFNGNDNCLIAFSNDQYLIISSDEVKSIPITGILKQVGYFKSIQFADDAVTVTSEMDPENVQELGSFPKTKFMVKVNMRGIQSMLPVGCAETLTYIY